MKKSALIVALWLACSGCYTVQFNSSSLASQPSGPAYSTWTHSFFWGLIPVGKVNLDQCGEPGIKRMKSQIGGLGLIAYALTGGIWTPMHVKLVCAPAKTSAAFIDGGDTAAVVEPTWANDAVAADPDFMQDQPLVFAN